jgi:hypothetical protein
MLNSPEGAAKQAGWRMSERSHSIIDPSSSIAEKVDYVPADEILSGSVMNRQ